MKRIALIFITITLVSITLQAQFNSTVVDSKTKSKMLIGNCDKEGLQKDIYGIYFDSQYDIYKPSESAIKDLSEKIKDFEFTIVMGTWCSDSKREVPRFYKVLNDAGYNDKRVKVIAVNKKKEAILVDISDMNIEKVPTFIIYKDDKEIGRIVETPKKSLESDLWKIIKKH